MLLDDVIDNVLHPIIPNLYIYYIKIHIYIEKPPIFEKSLWSALSSPLMSPIQLDLIWMKLAGLAVRTPVACKGVILTRQEVSGCDSKLGPRGQRSEFYEENDLNPKVSTYDICIPNAYSHNKMTYYKRSNLPAKAHIRHKTFTGYFPAFCRIWTPNFMAWPFSHLHPLARYGRCITKSEHLLLAHKDWQHLLQYTRSINLVCLRRMQLT